MATPFTSPLRTLLAFAVALVAALIIACPVYAQTAYADDSYELTLVASGYSGSLSAGDTFTVSEVLAKTGEDKFPLYALSTTVNYDTAALELVSYDAVFNKSNVHTNDNAVIFNTYSRSLAGITVDSGTTICTMTFKVLGSGSSDIKVKRVNMSDYTGMRSMPCTATGLQISVNSPEPAQPEGSQEGTTEGNATQDDKEMGTIGGMVEAVKKDPTTALEDGVLTPEGYQSLVKAGMTDSDLVSLGFKQEELDTAKRGESVTPAIAADLVKESSRNTETATGTSDASANTSGATNATNASNTSNASASASAAKTDSGSFPVVPVVIGVILVIAVVGGVIYVRKKNAE